MTSKVPTARQLGCSALVASVLALALWLPSLLILVDYEDSFDPRRGETVYSLQSMGTAYIAYLAFRYGAPLLLAISLGSLLAMALHRGDDANQSRP